MTCEIQGEAAVESYQIIEWGKPLERREYDNPEPEGSEVLLRVTGCGVCHSDLHIWEGHFDLGEGKRITLEDRGLELPFTMGHEVVGEVLALGPEWKAYLRVTDGSSIPGSDVVIAMPAHATTIFSASHPARSECGASRGRRRRLRTVRIAEAEIFDRSRFDRDVLASWEAHRSRRFSGVSPSIRYIG